MKLSSVLKYLTSRDMRIDFLSRKGFYDRMSDEEFIRMKYKAKMGKELDLTNPQTFNEKLQWMKLYDHNPLYTILVDKYKVKDFVSKAIGDEYVIPTIGVWHKAEEIDFNKLPNEFVLKCTHDSGGLVICKDKRSLDIPEAVRKLNYFLGRNFYIFGREWPYKNVEPMIIAEPYLEDRRTKELRDYKFFCFRGEVKALFIATERQKEGEDVKFDFFDENFNHLPFRQGHENAKVLPEKPSCFELMKELASILSLNLRHVRVDFYEVDGKVYFGELTFFDHGGWTPFNPDEWDYRFGEWLDLGKEQI